MEFIGYLLAAKGVSWIFGTYMGALLYDFAGYDFMFHSLGVLAVITFLSVKCIFGSDVDQDAPIH